MYASAVALITKWKEAQMIPHSAVLYEQRGIVADPTVIIYHKLTSCILCKIHFTNVF